MEIPLPAKYTDFRKEVHWAEVARGWWKFLNESHLEKGKSSLNSPRVTTAAKQRQGRKSDRGRPLPNPAPRVTKDECSKDAGRWLRGYSAGTQA